MIKRTLAYFFTLLTVFVSFYTFALEQAAELDPDLDLDLDQGQGQELEQEQEQDQDQELDQDLDAPLGVRSIDHIVAVVNDEVITSRELDNAIITATQNLLQQGIQPPDKESMNSQVLETIIVKQIQLQHAKEIGMSVGDSELDETIHRIAEDNQLSLQEFYAVLEEDGLSFNKFRQEIRDEIIMARIKERTVNHRVNVTEGEVDNFLRTQATSAVGNDEYLLAHILILVSERMDALEIQERSQRAEMALKKLQKGVEFAQVAAEFSDAPDAMQGGVLDWRPIAQMGPTFFELLSPLEMGDLTDVVQSPTGFHIFKLLDRRDQEDPVVVIDQTHARHILVKVSELTSESDAKQRIIQFKERIDNGANFAEIAKLHSEDGSAASGGDLGWISPGDTVPDFEEAMNNLQPGQISEPVQSPFGWHLIQVLERRSEDVSTESQRHAARQAIRSRKAEVVIQEWMQQLRDEAYIEYRTNEEES